MKHLPLYFNRDTQSLMTQQSMVLKKKDEMMTNPYTTSTQDSPEYKQLLSGRTDDLAQILGHIALGHSIALFGERRIGKTSLLFLLRDIINGQIEHYRSHMIDDSLKNAVETLKAK